MKPTKPMQSSRRVVNPYRSLLLIALVALSSAARAGTWKAGTARAKITPAGSIWLSGYASRDHPSEGALHDLWAKALALESPSGQRALLLTTDLIGVPRRFSADLCEAIRKRHGLDRRQIAISTSHTHSGPVVASNLNAMYFLGPEEERRVEDYALRLHRDLVRIAGQALARLSPCELSRGNGTATFAVNRRNNRAGDVPALRAANELKGPVDHDVPVLAVRDAGGELRCVVFGYACHATVLSFYQISGDYPGFAQIHFESAHPGVQAMFWAGCGGDINPLPRRKVELADEYGRRLAGAVDGVLARKMIAMDGDLTTRYAEIDLPFASLPTPEQLRADTASQNRYVARRARLLLGRVERGEPLEPTYPYPIQVWHVGDLRFFFLGGEVVVDYALRLKEELGAGRTWVAGYANDVMAYIPSLRVLREGGYEGGGAMVYYGLPSVWSEDVEELILAAARRLAR